MLRAAPRLIALATLAVLAARPAGADLIVAGDTNLPGTAIQTITLLPGTPFNQGSTPIVLTDVTGVGTLTLHRNAEVGDTITFSSISGGAYSGSNAAFGNYVFGNIPPFNGSDYPGEITNVVQNPGDPGFATGQPSSFASGDFSIGGASFGFELLSGPFAGTVLFTDPAVPFSFSATFNGLPPSAGTTLVNSGTDVLNVLVNTLNGPVIVAQSSDRRIVLSAVPEPGSIALCGVGGALAWAGRRKVSRRAC